MAALRFRNSLNYFLCVKRFSCYQICNFSSAKCREPGGSYDAIIIGGGKWNIMI